MTIFSKLNRLVSQQRPLRLVVLLVVSLSGLTCRIARADSEAPWVKSSYHRGDFKLVYGPSAAEIFISPDDFKVVRIAANDLAADITRVTGRIPMLRTDSAKLSSDVVLIGTLGKNPLIDKLVRQKKIDVGGLAGKWESFVIATVSAPLPGMRSALVIVGSDRRGTAYGVFELSQAMGVSPWYWWADVSPEHKANLIVSAGVRREGPPSVKYRGIFLNDEDWGLQPWAAKTFEPEIGDIGPQTYARIFQLLLRLKANTVWPAMHECTKAFNLYPQNKFVADDYAIIMGSSHAEPMLRNNVTEWRGKPEDFDYTKNREGVRRYWEERVAANGRFENIYTLGMRGIHDSPMQGPKTSSERIKVLEQIFADQRDMLVRHVNQDVTNVPQIFCPYKEVLADYRNGLKVPDDVTIVWPDDNFGYIRTFPTLEEQNRPGGFGVYYHISYLGRPLSNLWLETTPPSLIWEEMSKAYDHGVRKFWMVNVGDLKPGEIGTEFFLQMAWDNSRWRRDNLPDFLRQWAGREFGTKNSNEIASVLDEYYRLAFQRKPEHLQWYLPGETPRPSDLTSVDYGDEVQARLDAYEGLLARSERLYAEMPPRLKDAFYELVAYPVRGAALANQRFFMMEKSNLYAVQGRASASEWARRANDAGDRMKAETAWYNEKLAGGKWRHIMSMEPNPGQWQSMRSTAPTPSPTLAKMNIPQSAGLGVAIEGRLEPMREDEANASLPPFNPMLHEKRFVDVFNTGRSPAAWSAKSGDDWIKLSSAAGNLSDDTRIYVSIDWSRAPVSSHLEGTVRITGAGATRVIKVPITHPKSQPTSEMEGFAESTGVVSIEAEQFSKKIDRPSASWQMIPGLGRTGDSVAIFPTTAASIDKSRIGRDAPVLEYQLMLSSSGNFDVTCYLVPTHPLLASSGLRYAIGIDDQPPEVVSVNDRLEVSSREWSSQVLNETATRKTTVRISSPGMHVLKLYMVDPGVVIDKIVMDGGGLRPSYLGPPETRITY